MASNVPLRRLELRIDVSGALPHRPGVHEVALTAWLPPAHRLGPAPLAIFASPGGGYTRHYYDIQHPGLDGYSEAEHHASLGTIFIAYDHLGVGDSSTAAIADYSVADLAAANDAAVREVVARLAEGRLTAGYPTLPHLTRIGIGQSMGGCVTIAMQGAHATFDAIGVLGFSAVHTTLPQRNEADRVRAIAAHAEIGNRPLQQISVEESSRQVVDFVYPFHWEDVSPVLLDADMAGGYPLRQTAPAWGSLTVPPCAVTMMTPGVVAMQAAAVQVPVFVALGERDVSAEPHGEPGAFRASRDIELLVVPQMAHMHNFAGTRELLWQRIQAFGERVAVERLG
jgi:alpha-beta hydrolase superfamily lysophospholipase